MGRAHGNLLIVVKSKGKIWIDSMSTARACFTGLFFDTALSLCGFPSSASVVCLQYILFLSGVERADQLTNENESVVVVSVWVSRRAESNPHV